MFVRKIGKEYLVCFGRGITHTRCKAKVGCYSKQDNKDFRTWGLVKWNGSGSTGHISIPSNSKTIVFPQELIRKRIKIVVEILDDEKEKTD
jgi:hypothetical protein